MLHNRNNHASILVIEKESEYEVQPCALEVELVVWHDRSAIAFGSVKLLFKIVVLDILTFGRQVQDTVAVPRAFSKIIALL